MAYPSTKGTKIGEKAKSPRPGIPLNEQDILSLIHKHRGNLSKVADALGTTRVAVRKRCELTPHLGEALKEARCRWIDEIEQSVLSDAANSNDTTLKIFVLKTQGRDRGWDQSESQHAAKDIATAAFDFIIKKQQEQSKS